jgi:hypothetical protein
LIEPPRFFRRRGVRQKKEVIVLVRVLKPHVTGVYHRHPGDVYELEDTFVDIMTKIGNVVPEPPPAPTPAPHQEPKHPDHHNKHPHHEPEPPPKPYRRRDMKAE